MRSTHAAPGETNEGATAHLALSSKSVSATHVLFIRLIMGVLRSHMKGITIVPGTAHHRVYSDGLTVGIDETGRRWERGR